MSDEVIGFWLGVLLTAVLGIFAMVYFYFAGANAGAGAACVQQGYTTGIYENGKVVCSRIERTELGVAK